MSLLGFSSFLISVHVTRCFHTCVSALTVVIFRIIFSLRWLTLFTFLQTGTPKLSCSLVLRFAYCQELQKCSLGDTRWSINFLEDPTKPLKVFSSLTVFLK